MNYLEKQLDEKQDAVNISNQRTNKIPVIAIDNYNNTLKEYDSLYAAYKEIQINSGMIIYSCKNMHKPKKKYTFCYKKNHLTPSLPSTTRVVFTVHCHRRLKSSGRYRVLGVQYLTIQGK